MSAIAPEATQTARFRQQTALLDNDPTTAIQNYEYLIKNGVDPKRAEVLAFGRGATEPRPVTGGGSSLTPEARRAAAVMSLWRAAYTDAFDPFLGDTEEATAAANAAVIDAVGEEGLAAMQQYYGAGGASSPAAGGADSPLGSEMNPVELSDSDEEADAQYEQLPAGAYFVGPDGKKRQK